MRNNNIRPNGLKGNEAIDRMKSLMGIAPMNESTIDRTTVKLTKRGPDGKIYGIVQENQIFYIKTTTKEHNLVAEDFQYIGGLANKKDKAYKTYAKAIKQLNLSFISIAESTGNANLINAFRNDNLLNENEEEVIDEVEGTEGEELEEGEAQCGIVRGKGHDKHIMEVDVELTDEEKAIDEMITNGDADETVAESFMQNHRLKIGNALDIISEGETKSQQFKTLFESLSEKEKANLIEGLKKKA